MNFSVCNNNVLPINRAYTNFVSSTYPPAASCKDFFTRENYLDCMLNKDTVSNMIKSNPVITKLLRSKNIKPAAGIDNFNKTIRKHCIDTSRNAANIYNFLTPDLKSQANLNFIKKGALLHDIGKIFIPKEILNKNGRLAPSEAEIMHLHSRLGEEMLLTQNIEPEVLNIVKYHHQNLDGSGYPEIRRTLSEYDINTQITSLADKYTALREHRSYKPAKSEDEALAILKNEVDNGQINPYVYNALKGYVNNHAKI